MNSGYVLRLKVTIAENLLMLLIYIYQISQINAKENFPNSYIFLLIFQRDREIMPQKAHFERIKAVYCVDYVFLPPLQQCVILPELSTLFQSSCWKLYTESPSVAL